MTATYTPTKTMGNEPTLYSDWNTYVRDNIDYLKQQADTRQLIVKVFGDTDTVATGDGKGYLTIPALLDGYNLVAAHAACYTAGTPGTALFQIVNVTNGTSDMLTTRISIDSGEYSSYSAAAAPVIGTAVDDVNTGDILRFDVDAINTGMKALEYHLKFQPA